MLMRSVSLPIADASSWMEAPSRRALRNVDRHGAEREEQRSAILDAFKGFVSHWRNINRRTRHHPMANTAEIISTSHLPADVGPHYPKASFKLRAPE